MSRTSKIINKKFTSEFIVV